MENRNEQKKFQVDLDPTLSNQQSIWANDVLGRKPFADFLTDYLECKIVDNLGELRSYVIAIDDEWGTGKTFFVKAWQEQLESLSEPFETMYFDAWQADCLSDPLIAFIAALKERMLMLAEKQSGQGAIVVPQIEAAFNKIGKAIVPAGKIFLRSLLTRYIGDGIKEFGEAFGKQGAVDTSIISDSLVAGVDAGVGELFNKALIEETSKRLFIDSFKSEIANTLKSLKESGNLKLPFFVFVDELDRSRPDFSIQLLEGIKHLFDVPGVCFVVSTNISQLSESVRGVYGSNFDGRRYLNRLFDVRYALPKPTQKQYAIKLVNEANWDELKVDTGLPVGERYKFDVEKTLAGAFEWISNEFDLDLRSQGAVMNLSRDACNGLVAQGYRIQFLWLSFLAALYIKNYEGFLKLEAMSGEHEVTLEDLKAMSLRGVSKTLTILASVGQQQKSKEFKLVQIISTYASTLNKNLNQLHKIVNSERSNDYPERALHFIHEEYVKQQGNGYAVIDEQSKYPSTTLYFALIRNAGYLSYVDESDK